MTPKTRVAILFGGKTAEHEVSLQSARNVIDAIDRDKYDVVLIGIDKQGRWHLNEASNYLLHAENPKLIALNSSNEQVALVTGKSGAREIVSTTGNASFGNIDVVFPVLHGTFGEDGTIQGLLKLANVPFVGAGVLGSSVGMDKDVMKRLLRDAGIANAKFVVFRAYEKKAIDYEIVTKQLGSPVFIKPANLGSSVGIHKAKDEKTFLEAIENAFLYDKKIIIEEAIKGREIECAVLGNEHPAASLPGEIIPQHEFYSYEAKYIDAQGAKLEIPAKLPDDIIKEVQQLAVRAFKVLECEGMARVDLFLTEDGRLYVNEINTIPGFTKISMYPKLWEISGIPYSELIDRLIQLAMERFEQESLLKTTFDS